LGEAARPVVGSSIDAGFNVSSLGGAAAGRITGAELLKV
jgi:hypothetical protein